MNFSAQIDEQVAFYIVQCASMFSCVSLPSFFGSEFCRGEAMVANIKPQQWKKEESKRLRGEKYQVYWSYI